MDLLEEVISDDKFERNTKFFKKIIFISIFIGIILIIYAAYNHQNNKAKLEYNAKLTKIILNNDINFNEFKGYEIDKIAKFNIINAKLNKYQQDYYKISELKEDQINAKQTEFYNEIYEKLQNLSNDFALSNSAKNYIGMLMLDMPKLFKANDIETYFNSLILEEEQNLNYYGIILKALWLKNNANSQDNLTYLNKYIQLIKQEEIILKKQAADLFINNKKKYFLNKFKMHENSNALLALLYFKKLYEY